MGPAPALVGGIGLIKGIFDVGKHIYDGIRQSKQAKYSQREVDRANQEILNQLKKNEEERLNERKKYDKIIKDLENQMKEQKNSFEKMKIENEKKLIEQKKKEEEKAIQEIQEKEKAIIECKKYLSEEFVNCIINALNEYYLEERKWVKQITKINIENRKKDFKDLFQQLFILENIQNKMKIFIEIIK